jgi:hypothetical protein
MKSLLNFEEVEDRESDKTEANRSAMSSKFKSKIGSIVNEPLLGSRSNDRSVFE